MQHGDAAAQVALHDFKQYAHLKHVAKVVKDDPEFYAALGPTPDKVPDILVVRELTPLAEINKSARVVDDAVAARSALKRTSAKALPLLHAAISCAWALGGGSALEIRSNARDLIDMRKGHLPHLMVVTADPSPERIAQVALGTGSVDCVYHLALPELIAAVAAYGDGDVIALLRTMVDGDRLKDIADLPLDLVV